MSRSARASFIAAGAVVASVLALWMVLPEPDRTAVFIYLPVVSGIIALILSIPGLMGHLRDVRWVFAAMLPGNLFVAVSLGLVLSSAEGREDLGHLPLALFFAVAVLGVALLGLSVAGPRAWRPHARQWAMLGAALGYGAFVLVVVALIAATVS